MVTEKDKIHKFYLNICENIVVDGLEEYNIRELLYNEAFYAQNSGWKEAVKSLINAMAIEMTDMKSIVAEYKNNDLLLISTKWNRRDHDEYWNKICSVFSEYTRISIGDKTLNILSRIRRMSFRRFVRNITIAKKIYKQFEMIDNRKHKIYLVSKLIMLKDIHCYLETVNISPKVVMCFFDSGFFENVAMNFYKKRGAITVTNQHGQPVYKSHDYDRMNQSQVLNFKCDYFFAKGLFTKKQFIKAGIDGNRVIIVDSFNKINNLMLKVQCYKTFCVFLNCIALQNSSQLNAKLVEIAKVFSERNGYKFYLKIHPTDDVENYRNINCNNLLGVINTEKSMDEIVREIDFAIYNQSAIFLDLLDHKVRAYRWDDGEEFPLIDNENDEFDEVETLEKLCKLWDSKTVNEKNQYFYRTSMYYNGEGNAKENIEKTIINLLNKNTID